MSTRWLTLPGNSSANIVDRKVLTVVGFTPTHWLWNQSCLIECLLLWSCQGPQADVGGAVHALPPAVSVQSSLCSLCMEWSSSRFAYVCPGCSLYFSGAQIFCGYALVLPGLFPGIHRHFPVLASFPWVLPGFLEVKAIFSWVELNNESQFFWQILRLQFDLWFFFF